jgi:hypothetical protein
VFSPYIAPIVFHGLYLSEKEYGEPGYGTQKSNKWTLFLSGVYYSWSPQYQHHVQHLKGCGVSLASV